MTTSSGGVVMSDLIGTLQAADSVSAGGAAEASEISKGREGASESNHPGFGGAAAKDDEARDLDVPAPKLNLAMSHFDVVDELGDGSFSEVLHVVRRETGARYALKVMHKRHILREKKAAFVKNERAAMDACRRVPGVVRLHFTFQDCNSLYLGMELCAGGELFDQIRRRKPRGVPVRAVRFYAAELLDILQGVHAEGVVHRDLKPENILLDERGHVNLTDFGSCLLEHDAAAVGRAGPDGGGGGDTSGSGEAVNEEVELARRRAQLAFVGTCDYVPPEILGEPGGEEVGYAENLALPTPPARALDFWSLGCVIYQALTGVPPFRGANEFLTYQNVMDGKMAPWPEWFDEEDEECENDIADGDGAGSNPVGGGGGGGEEESTRGLKEAAKDLVSKLLVHDPFERLGSGPGGAAEVRSHAFFSGVSAWGDGLRAGNAPRWLAEDPRSPSVSSVSSDDSSEYDCDV